MPQISWVKNPCAFGYCGNFTHGRGTAHYGKEGSVSAEICGNCRRKSNYGKPTAVGQRKTACESILAICRNFDITPDEIFGTVRHRLKNWLLTRGDKRSTI